MATSWYERGYSVGRRWRWTVALAVLAFFIGALSTFYWHEEVFGFLLAPAGGRLSPFDGKPVVNAPTAMFGSTLGLSVYGGKLLAFPVLIVGALTLIKPLMPFRWWLRFIAINTVIAIALFALGDIFVYFVMLPVSMNFLLSFGTRIVEPVILLDLYLELLFSLFKWIGLVFLLPLVMHILARLGWLSYQRAKGVYRIGFFLALFLSAIISPGLDGFLTMLVFGSMYSLYLIGLGAVWSVDMSQGNYLFLGTFGRFLRKIGNGVAWVLRKARAVVTSPLRASRWLRGKIWEYGSGIWR